MKVRQLIQQLIHLNPDAEVFLVDGYGYQPAIEIIPNSIHISHMGEMFDPNLQARDYGLTEEQWTKLKTTLPRCVVIAS